MAFENLFGEGGTAAERAARQRANRSILDGITREISRFRQQLGASRSQPAQQLSRQRARDRAPHREDRAAQRQRRRARAADGADRRARFVGRARQVDVRSPGAGLLVGGHARVLVQVEPRHEQPRVPGERHQVAVPRDVAPRLDRRRRSTSTRSSTSTTCRCCRTSCEKLRNTPDGDGNLLDHSLVL